MKKGFAVVLGLAILSVHDKLREAEVEMMKLHVRAPGLTYYICEVIPRERTTRDGAIAV